MSGGAFGFGARYCGLGFQGVDLCPKDLVRDVEGAWEPVGCILCCCLRGGIVLEFAFVRVQIAFV